MRNKNICLEDNIENSLEEFKTSHTTAFGDERLANRWKDIFVGITGAKSCKVAQIASHSPRQTKNIWYTQKAMYRFLKNSHFTPEEILTPLYERTKKDLKEEKEITAIIDLSPIEKPYSRKMEKLGKVLRKDKEGTVNGYTMLQIILIGKNKTGIGLVYEGEALF